MGTRDIVAQERDVPEGLTTQQALFCWELAADPRFQLTAAARAAGFKHPAQAAQRVMKLVPVQEYLGKLLRERMDTLELSATMVLEELLAIAKFDPADLHDEDGRLLPIHEMPARARRALAGLELEDNGEVRTAKVRYCNKLEALQLLMRHMGMFHDKIKLTHEIGPEFWAKLIQQAQEPRVVDDNVIDVMVEKLEDEE